MIYLKLGNKLVQRGLHLTKMGGGGGRHDNTRLLFKTSRVLSWFTRLSKRGKNIEILIAAVRRKNDLKFAVTPSDIVLETY